MHPSHAHMCSHTHTHMHTHVYINIYIPLHTNTFTHHTHTHTHTHTLQRPDWSMARRCSEKICKTSTRNLCPLQNKYFVCGLPGNPYECHILHYLRLQPFLTEHLFSNPQTKAHRVQTNHKKIRIGSVCTNYME